MFPGGSSPALCASWVYLWALLFPDSFFGGIITIKPDKTLNRIILEVVDKQIRQRNPPATKKTFDRLVREGIAESEARRLIGCVVASEMFDVLREQKSFDEVRFVKALENLPALSE